MRSIVILGGGTAGTIMANKLRSALPGGQWRISVVDRDPVHYYQPGFLFLPFGIYRRGDVVAPKQHYLPPDVEFILSGVEGVDPAASRVTLEDGRVLEYDLLVVASGVQVQPGETEGMLGAGWGREIFEFYTLPGAEALTAFLQTWPGGRLVMHIAEMPIKCPVAPLEFVFLADWWFRRRGMRERVQIDFVTPLTGAFTRPVASRMLGEMLARKGINLLPEFAVASVDAEARRLLDWEGREVPYDCLVTVPVNLGDAFIARSGLGDEYNYVPTDPGTLRSKRHENIFVIGDATDLPTSKAGSVAHFEAETLLGNMLRAIRGEPLETGYDGHANCFVEAGDGRGILIDFNYETEPLPGVFPWAGIGPFSLLRETRLNHLAKLGFRWVYWDLLIRGRYIPVPARMSLAGKVRPSVTPAD